MKLFETEEQIIAQLAPLYDDAEAANIADWVLESLTGRNRPMRKLDKSISLSEDQLLRLEQYMLELMAYRPVQYVLGESYFYGMKLFVDERVLIPRPETEELADMLVKYARANNLAQPAILDIGTGSGCLALAAAKGLPGATALAADISDAALAVASGNAAAHKLDITFLTLDILDPEAGLALPALDIIVSNPPYITLPEQQSILPNVLQYEPHGALFVTNEDPQQFYKAIEAFARRQLKPGGVIFLELHHDFAVETQAYFKGKGWDADLKKDMQEQDRMLICRRADHTVV